MKITDKRSELSPLIEGGDWIVIPGHGHYMVLIPAGLETSEKIALIGVGTGGFYFKEDGGAWFNHPQHMRNHLKKHYGSYQHIKNQQLEVIIHDKTYSGF